MKIICGALQYIIIRKMYLLKIIKKSTFLEMIIMILVIVILIFLYLQGGKEKGGRGGVCEMLKCQIALADMGAENSGDR